MFKMEDETQTHNSDGMNEIIIDFGDICRFCLLETKSSVSIYDKCKIDELEIKAEDSIGYFISKMTSIEMNNPDCFPLLVCEHCYDIIKVCYNFSQNCVQADRSLRECYIKTLKEAKAKFSKEINASVKEEVFEVEEDYNFLKEEGASDEDSMNVNDAVNKSSLDENVPDKCKRNPNRKLESTEEEKKKKKNVRSAPSKNFKSTDYYSIMKAENIKQKYKKMNTLTERLEEAQSKLAEDIRRSENILLLSRTNKRRARDESKISSSHKSVVSSSSKEISINNLVKCNNPELKSQCRICSEELENQFLVEHYQKVHKLEWKNNENSCNSSLKDENSDNKTGLKKRFSCTECVPPKTYDRRDSAIRHMRLVHRRGFDDSGERFLKEISERTSIEKCYACARCNYQSKFASRFSLNRHLKNVHKLGRQEISPSDGKTIAKKENPKSLEEYVKVHEEEGQENLKLFKLYICTECTPPLSFSLITLLIKHKQDSHNKQLEDIRLNELTPVYVNSLDVFKKGDIVKKSSVVKVICKNCDPAVEFDSTSDFVNHMHELHNNTLNDNWDINSKVFFESVNELFEGEENDNNKGDRIWKCSDCSASYVRKHSLNSHMKEKHNKSLKAGTIDCPEPDCNETFYTNKQVIQHGITVHEKYFADLHNIFKDKILQRNCGTDERIRKFKCDICESQYLRKTSLKRHLLKTHLGGTEKEGAICPYCGKTLSCKLNLKSHIEFVHEAVFVSCPICKKNVNFKTIGRHYKVHQTVPTENQTLRSKYLCNLCGRVLKSKTSFVNHQKIHSNVRDHICDTCGSGYTTKKNLQIHKKVHEGALRKVFECEQCDKVFYGKHTLNRHLLTHSGKKNFICEICSKCFYTIQELNRHVRYHKKDYRFDCQLCEMRFMDKSRFRHHMMRHRNVRPHKCHFCDKVFIVRRKMNLHMAARHNVQVRSTKTVWKDPKTYIPLDDLL